MVELSSAVGLAASIALGLGVVAMLYLVYLGYKQDKEVENESDETNGETAT